MPVDIRPFTRALTAAALLLLVAPLVSTFEVLAQVRTVGAITGTVTDPEGNAVPGATVILRDERTNIARESVSNDQGTFRFLDLQAGSYEVTVTLTGFQATVFKNVAVESARTTDLAVHMNVGQVSEAIEVIGATPTLSVTTNTLSTTVTHADVQNLPLAGRNVLNFALLVPGAQTAGTDPRQSTYQGMPGATINITVDGINNNSGAFRSGGTSFFATVPPRLDAVEEVNISSGGLGADAGAEGAMAIRFVTRRGTNDYHGGGFFQYVNEKLNANNYFNNARGLPKPRSRRNEFGGNLGGPILRNKAFFFVNWEEARVPNVVIVNQSVLTEEVARGVFRYRGTDGVERTADLLAIARAGGFSGTPDPIVANQLSTIASTYGSAALSVTDLYRRNLSFNEPQKAIEHYPTTRIDYQLSQKTPPAARIAGFAGSTPTSRAAACRSSTLAWRPAIRRRIRSTHRRSRASRPTISAPRRSSMRSSRAVCRASPASAASIPTHSSVRMRSSSYATTSSASADSGFRIRGASIRR